MPDSDLRHVEHGITVSAPADTVYRLIEEIENWPWLFPPTVHIDVIEREGSEERIRLWAVANGEPKTWTSRRRLDSAARRVEFRQEVSQPPVGAMGGTWIVEPVGDASCRVRLLHHFRAVDDDPEKLAWIVTAVETNSTAELAALKVGAEMEATHDGRLLTFDDTVRIAGAAKDVYDFLNEARRWEERLPHVARVSLREDTPGLQLLEMDTRTRDGSTHTTRSVRVCTPHSRIVYKQIVLPPLMTVHTGSWTLRETEHGVDATSRHTVVVNPESVPRILGEHAGLAQARAFLQDALSTNSLATLGRAKEYAEGYRQLT
ncbi:aromatase/cyclase [Nocardiopsis dassonvillei]|uniref:aromatase/cyclase n=1 Tax=Nocardiopsis dassonvillei TaxID=2014 RepID=UPI003625987F